MIAAHSSAQVANMACALLRMCIPAEHEDKDPAPPASRPCNTRPEIYASFIRSQPSALNAGAAADQRCDIDALGADLLSVILAHCDIRDIFSARVSLLVPARCETRCPPAQHAVECGSEVQSNNPDF